VSQRGADLEYAGHRASVSRMGGQYLLMLVDCATIIVRSGKGGDGVVSFRRAKYVPKGGPDGGDGGDGGSVVLLASPGVDTLLDFSGRHHWVAQNGQPGRGKQCTGAKGQDLMVRLPPGTLVYDDQTGELIVDLDKPGVCVNVARGGHGGFGNEHFKSATNQTPRKFTHGEPAIGQTLRLELKLIADIGLVGMPNAGKSTLLSKVSKARPKIGAYPFTTIQPNLGIVDLSPDRRMVVADIPGLIEGASQGLGLGIEFLRHIERTRLLVHLVAIDPFASDVDALAKNYRIIREELQAHSPQLAQKPQLVALSKLDLLEGGDQLQLINALEQQISQRVIPISAATGSGVRLLLEACWEQLKKPAAIDQSVALATSDVQTIVNDPIAVEVTDGCGGGRQPDTEAGFL